MKDNYLEGVHNIIITPHEDGTVSIGLFAKDESWILADSKLAVGISIVCSSDPNKQLDFATLVRKNDKVYLKRMEKQNE